MNICIITSENRRLYPAAVFSIEDNEHKHPMSDIDDVYDLLYKNQNILVISDQFDQYGKELKIFNGQLGKLDIKALFTVKSEKNSTNLNSVMTLSEAAKKWGLAGGSTVRKAIERGKFEQDEVKQAGDVWITTYSAMERVFGPIKNEEEAFVIYDDFESVYLTKVYYEYAQLAFLKGPNIDMKAKDLEIKYQYIKDIFIKGLNAIRNNQKVIIKKSINNQIKQVICTEDEYFLHIEAFRSRRNLSPEWIDRLLDDLKAVPK
ncbi:MULTISPECIES: helix-turn-helix domain-containing protein [unclassified Clostridium]|uniref:helix-turn-helix domain-containing protein n=1 Tax=unclassified Clostridium TaxID=2614128 RepID=UPI00029819A2|nr:MULTISPECIES: helix-turn-helix domain-containing protein [unclassified Clostridium]EKQ50217.1 MAG: hypothetical protein A370_05880 [Clostridium sp. Maddingley MBC34-26]